MYRICMAWFFQTVTTLFAAVVLTIPLFLAVITSSYADSQNLQGSAGGWNVKSDNASQEVLPRPESVKPENDIEVDTEVGTEIDNVTVGENPRIIESATIEAKLADANSLNSETTQVAEPSGSAQVNQRQAVGQDQDDLLANDSSNETVVPDNQGFQEELQPEPVIEDEVLQLDPEQQAQVDALAALQLSRDIEQQHEQLKKSLETEDAFSSKLGEDYLGYGKLLRKSGQIDESIKALTSALHIAKVNNGIYSIEQRPALRELFDIHYDLQNTEDFEDYLERILWIENRNPELSGDASFEILLKVGNRYIDQFLTKPVAGQASVEVLLRAKHHLVTAIRGFGRRPVSEVLMPYGEIALISFLESKIQPNVDKTASLEDSRLKRVNTLSGNEFTLASYVADPFPKGEAYLQIYLRKAQREGDTEHVVRALTSLGDLNQLFGRHSNGSRYYELAWLASQDLDPNQDKKVRFDEPTLLPDFNYAYQRQKIPSSRETVSVSLKLLIGRDGRVKKVERANLDDGLEKYFTKARRAVKRLVFRPKLIDAKAVETEQYEYTTKVRLRR